MINGAIRSHAASLSTSRSITPKAACPKGRLESCNAQDRNPQESTKPRWGNGPAADLDGGGDRPPK